MKDIGIVVCNYNKKDDVLKCVESILESELDGISYDVTVVDNASTDCSAEALEQRFSDRITVIRNKENLGGSGGFCTGLRHVMGSDYEYIMCVDNDVLFDRDAIRELHDFLEKHPETGMAGSKILVMDDPERIQTYGAMIDYEKYRFKDLYEREPDRDDLPEYVYCDYVPACSLIARKSAVEKVGLMPEENFIYWDDMEWGVRFNLAGYKVAAVSASKIWHRGGGIGSASSGTFTKYYSLRNRIRFFLKYLKEDARRDFAEKILDEVYRSVVGSGLKGDTGMAETVIYALDDAVHDVTGKAADYKILERRPDNRLDRIMKGKAGLGLVYHGEERALRVLLTNFQRKQMDYTVTLYTNGFPEPDKSLSDLCVNISLR